VVLLREAVLTGCTNWTRPAILLRKAVLTRRFYSERPFGPGGSTQRGGFDQEVLLREAVWTRWFYSERPF
jgi:hypothetical protein